MPRQDLQDQYADVKASAQSDVQRAATAIDKGVTTDDWQDAIDVLTDLGATVAKAQDLQAQLEALG